MEYLSSKMECQNASQQQCKRLQYKCDRFYYAIILGIGGHCFIDFADCEI